MSEIQSDMWNKVVLTDLLTLRHGYQFRTNDFAEKGVKVVKIGQVIGNGLVDTSNCDRVRDDLFKSKKEFLLKEGDVLMSLTGNIGRVGVLKGNSENLLQNWITINGKAIKLDNMFFEIPE